MDYKDYIKDDSDGHRVNLNRKGRDLAKSFIAKNGGATGVHKLTGIARSAITSLKLTGSCAPEVWQKLFDEYMFPKTVEDGAGGATAS